MADVLFAEMTDHLSQLHLVDSAAITLIKPEPDYFIHLHSQSSETCGSDAKIAATSTNNSIRLYTRSNLGYFHTIYGHEKPLTGVKFSPADPNLVYSSSLDGTIRCWDLRQRTGKKTSDHTDAALVYEGYKETNNVFTSFDVSCDGRMLCAGTEAQGEDVHVIFWDNRMSGRLGVYEESHQDDITEVSFHPTKRNHLITSSMDGLVCLFDVSEPTEDDALIQTYNAQAAVNRIGWCSKDDCNVYAITTIESLHVWDTEEFDPVVEVTEIKDKFEGSRAVDYLVDCFHTSPPGQDFSLNVLAGTNSGGLHLLDVAPGGEIEHRLSLSVMEGGGRGHSALVRCMDWDTQSQSMVTGGEDGLVCLWKPEKPAQQAQAAQLKAKPASKMRGKSTGSAKAKAYDRKAAKS